MHLYLIRHSNAEDRDSDQWPDDSQRPLTGRGRERFQWVAAFLGGHVPDMDVVLSSRYVRAWQTAELLISGARWPAPTPCPALEFAEFDKLYEVLRSQAGAAAVAAVGHEPYIGEFASHALTGDEDIMTLDVKKGAVICLEFEGDCIGPGAATLLWVVTPKLVQTLQTSPTG